MTLRHSTATALFVAVGLFCVILQSDLSRAAGKKAGKTVHVQIENIKFDPVTVTASVGDTIVWKNNDIVPHTVTAVAAKGKRPAFDSTNINPGAEFKLIVRAGYGVDYGCNYHPAMKGHISLQ